MEMDSRVTRILGLVGIQSQSKVQFSSYITLLKTIAAEKLPYLLGIDDGTYSEICQWISVSVKISSADQQQLPDMLKWLDEHLLLRSYLVGWNLTLGDILVYDALGDNVVQVKSFPEVVRWMDHIHNLVKSTTTQSPFIPKSSSKIPSYTSSHVNAGNSMEVKQIATYPDKSTKPMATKDEATTVAAASITTADSPPSDVQPLREAKKKDKNKDKESSSDASALKPTDKSTTAATAEVVTETASESPSLLDMRVGLVVRAWDHPESDKLICEEIDLGEPSGNRQIASGIRAFYTSAEVQGRRVVVLCNLKDRSLAGFKSQGMVLAASNADHTQVRLLSPPADANPGDKVMFEGATGDPATPAQMAKKKIWEKLSPELRTDSTGRVCFRGQPVSIGKQPCNGELVEASVG